MKKRASVSQQRIARELGVSQALVSLVLNGKRENISEDSYQRIWNHALKVGYRPKGMQLSGDRAMATNVGFVLRAGVRLYTQSNYFSHIQHGLHFALLERGYNTFFFGSEDDLRIKDLQSKLKNHHLLGLVILGEVEERFLRSIIAVQKNVVSVSATYPGLCNSVMPNEAQAIQHLVGHLTSLGHQKFAWIGGNKTLHHNVRRRVALVDTLKQHGLKLGEQFMAEMTEGDRLDGLKAAEVLLQRMTPKNFPTAWVCLNGLMARGVINCLMQNGWRVPEQISVVAVDATRVCVEERPEITGAHSDPEKMGITAAELLVKSVNSQDGILSDVILPSQLTIRETSAKPSA